MIRTTVACSVVALLLASPARAQEVGVQGAAGVTLVDAGYSVAGAVNYSPTNRLSLVFGYDHTHVESRTRITSHSTSSFRGGTLFLGSAELQVTPFGRHRWGPYGLGGLAAGWSRPNVNATFPDRLTNEVRALFLGGGLQVPVEDRVRIFFDWRLLLGAEGRNGMVAVSPLRVGLNWTF
ncbi:MAG: hypothetical protein M3Y40_09435 [Chloroflexota bacterium]|nr:hypothetical protein [Chloroflexota bacterium]